MRILLPPSEGKTSGGRGRPVRARGTATAGTSAGPLAAARADVLAALATVLASGPAKARAALQLPAGVAEAALAANAAVLDSPTTPALRRYTGVVYDGLGFAALPPAAQRLAGRSTLIFSGLWGVVRGDEPVPDYRVPAKAVLPGIGVAGTFWRRVLEEHLPPVLRDELVLDLRSSDYAAMWRPPAALAERVVTVRVLSPLPRGGRGVVSYPSKLAKGQLSAALLTRAASGSPPRDAADVLAAWCDHVRASGADADRCGEIADPNRIVLHTG